MASQLEDLKQMLYMEDIVTVYERRDVEMLLCSISKDSELTVSESMSQHSCWKTWCHSHFTNDFI